jgi:low affinity Fe/Cu permease
MRKIPDSSGSAMRDIEPSAVRTWHFANLARHLATLAGRPAAFALAALAVLLWAASGPFFGFSDTWQLVINTSTTIITFLMVFIIQNTQNRDTAAIQIKLDELIRATQGAHNAILDLEQLDEEQLKRYLQRYEELAAAARKRLVSGHRDTDAPEVKPQIARG